MSELAVSLGVSNSFVKFSEAGCYNIIPTVYKTHTTLTEFELWLPEVNKEYQEFRYAKRIHNFTTSDFSHDPPRSMQKLLDMLDLNPYQFAVRACVQHAEVHRLLTSQKATLPSNLVDFFQTVGLPNRWILDFNSYVGEQYEDAV